jgi:hypothetical protein
VRPFCKTLALLLLAPAMLTARADVLISEFMASNTGTLQDDYGQYEDWIELFNSGSTNVSLLDWSLTDNAGNLHKWRFPATNLAARSYLIVFASNRDRRTPGQTLHTNFRLDAGGEYLALVRPDGTIATQFSPSYPGQLPDVSFGFGYQTPLLVTTVSAGRVLVPTNDALGQAWASNSFSDASWTRATNGIGYETGDSELGGVADDVLADSPLGYWRLEETGTNGQAVNQGSLGAAADGAFLGGVTNGMAGPQAAAFPGFEPTNCAARFNGNDAKIDIPYSAALNPSGPFTAELWVRLASLASNRYCPLSSINIAGSYTRTGFLFYKSGTDWQFRLGSRTNIVASAAGGTPQSNVWTHLVGVYDGHAAALYVDGALAGSAVPSAPFECNTNMPFRIGANGDGTGQSFFHGDIDEVAIFDRALTSEEISQRYAKALPAYAYTNLIRTDLRAAMHNVNASAYARFPFTLSRASDITQLTLRMRYDDGFAAYVNGAPVASANAPETLAWDSAATNRRDTADALQPAAFGLSGFGSYLRDGSNTLAIQGLNLAASNPDFLLVPELEVQAGALHTQEPRYFTAPTPAAANSGGVADLGPIITQAGCSPDPPGSNDDLVVTCRVAQAFTPVAGVSMTCRVMFNASNTVAMLDDGLHGDGAAGDGIYGAVVAHTNYTAGQMVRWYFSAADTQAHVSRWPLFTDPLDSAEYLGTVVQPGYVTSSLPVIHLFAPASVLQPGPTTSQTGADSQAGSRVSLYFDGEFYDNVYMALRGNTTAGYNKKSHRIEFNREHPFRHPGPGGRIRKTSFVADYPDPAYMRQGLSYWLCDLAGAPAPFYEPYRLQLNGSFYELANHNDVHGEELLDRLGYDPNGALYNAAGTIQTSQFSTGGFEKKTRLWDTDADYTALAGAIAESVAAGQRQTNLFERLDLPEVINYLAVARFVHENDDVWANMSLYHDNDGDDLWRIVPLDLNLSWGAAYMDTAAFSGIQSTNDALKGHPLYGSSLTPWQTGGNWNRLYDAVFQSPLTREMFLRRMRTILDTWVKPPGTPADQLPLEAKVLAWRDLIADEAARDRAWWGWPAKGGQCNFDPGITLSNGVASLLVDFLEKRRQHFYGKHCVANVALPVGLTKTSNAGIPLAQPTNAVIDIASWDYSPASGNQDQEYVELRNTNSFAVDISGWKLDGGARHRFHPGTVIPAGLSLYVVPSVPAFRARSVSPRGGEGRFVQGSYNGHLSAWGETLTLSDDSGRAVATASFDGAPSAAQQYLRITEIMYNPAPLAGSSTDAQEFEYIELKNISTNDTLALAGVCLTNGIAYRFSGGSLEPGQSLVLARNPTAYQARYGTNSVVSGPYEGYLDNAGETIRLEDAAGEKVLEFDYNNAWYPITDGLGFSLVIRDELAPWDSWGLRASWRPSSLSQGSPGAADSAQPLIPAILVNEVLAHTDLPEVDSIELFNPTTTPADIGGWWLTDSYFEPYKYQVPTNTVLPPGGFTVITADAFGQGTNAFLLSEYGEQVCLFSADASGVLSGYTCVFDFDASSNGASIVRYVNSEGRELHVDGAALTLGTSNALPRVGPVVISEIMYHPPDATNGVDDDLDEYIELQNITGGPVPLYDVANTGDTWRLQSGVSYDFPSGTSLPSNGLLLVVGFDPATNPVQLAEFQSRYALSTNMPIYGPWSGKLDNSGERIELRRPGDPDVMPTNVIVPYYLVDGVTFGDGVAWPTNADGWGASLQRCSLRAFGDDPTNWVALSPTAGVTNVIPFSDPDSDHDGMPDEWEIVNGMTVGMDDAGEDSDGDGISNVQEYIAGTSPTNAVSALRIEAFDLQEGEADFVLRFLAVSNRTYQVEWRESLDAGSWNPLTNVLPESADRWFSVTNPPGPETNRFMRVVIP